MNEYAKDGGRRRGNRWRVAAWSGAALIWLLPMVAMQLTDEVVWDVTDFAVWGAMLLGAGVTYELAARKSDNTAYRVAVGAAVLAAFLLIWVQLAVGLF